MTHPWDLSRPPYVNLVRQAVALGVTLFMRRPDISDTIVESPVTTEPSPSNVTYYTFR
jgi:hypothetical protein